MRTVESITDELLARVPGLAEPIRIGAEEWQRVSDGSPPYADYVLGAIVAPFVAETARRGLDSSDRTLLTSLFSYLEELLGDPSGSVRDLVDVSFGEQLGSEKDVVLLVRDLMGPRLRRSTELV